MGTGIWYHAARKATYYPITDGYDTFVKAVVSVEEWFNDYPDDRGEFVILRTTVEEVSS